MSISRGRYVSIRVGALAVLAAAGVALAACSGSPTASPQAAGASGDAVGAACDQAIMVNIVNDAYDRQSVNLNTGDTLLVMNKTQDTFTLNTTPDEGLRYMVVDPSEMEHVPFNKSGTFVLGSKEHPNTTLTVHVATTKSYTCGERPVATITFGTNHQFSPDAVSVDSGQSILVVNAAGQTLEIVSTPDLGMGMGDQLYHAGEQQTLLFPDNGDYVFSPKEFPAAKLKVTVSDVKSN